MGSHFSRYTVTYLTLTVILVTDAGISCDLKYSFIAFQYSCAMLQKMHFYFQTLLGFELRNVFIYHKSYMVIRFVSIKTDPSKKVNL